MSPPFHGFMSTIRAEITRFLCKKEEWRICDQAYQSIIENDIVRKILINNHKLFVKLSIKLIKGIIAKKGTLANI